MAALKKMPKIQVDQTALERWGKIWLAEVATQPKLKAPSKRRKKAGVEPAPEPAEVVAEPLAPMKAKKPNYFDRKQAMDFGYVFDKAFGDVQGGDKTGHGSAGVGLSAAE